MNFTKLFCFVGLLLTACAGTEGQPDEVRNILSVKYVGGSVQFAVVDLGTPTSTYDFDDGSKAISWKRSSSKYETNVYIKSDERCVITMLTDATGTTIKSIGTVDDSLGAWQISYCKEQFSL